MSMRSNGHDMTTMPGNRDERQKMMKNRMEFMKN